MKKLLSIILAAAMILSLIPSVFAEGEGTVYTYNFNSKDTTFGYSSTLSTSTLLEKVTNEADGSVTVKINDMYDGYDDATGRNWKMFDTVDGVKTKFKETDSKLYQVAGFDTNALRVNFTQGEQWLALKIRVPEPGIYTMATKIYQNSSSRLSKGFMCMYPGNISASQIVYSQGNNGILNSGRLLSAQIYYKDTSLTAATDYDIPFGGVLVANVANEEFVYVIGSVSGNSGVAYVRNFTLTKISDSVTFGDTTAVNLVMGETQTATASLASGKKVFGCSEILYSTGNAEVATVEDGVVTAVGEGTTTLTARIGDATASIPVTVTAPEEDEQFTQEFGEGTYETDENKAFTAPAEGKATTTVNTYTTVIGGTNSTATPHTVELGEEFSITADEKDGAGNVFRYWVLGFTENKKVLTRDRMLEFMPTVETKHVIAVYEPENGATVSDESFYNANGQLLTDVKITDNKMPALPAMTGYGTASAWVQYGTNKEFAADATAPTENLMFVAKYAEPTTTYAINVVDGTGSGSYTYGQEVTCTATVPDGKVFKCWTKTPEGSETAKIISLDSTYTFNSWESCKLTAVFADEEPVFTGNKFSIILSTMGNVDNNTAYMAEFVGLGDAVEKGIQFGNKRVAMTTDAAQFTVVNDTTATDVTGYAILPDGTVIYDK